MEMRTFLVVAPETEAREELRCGFRAAGHRVVVATDEKDMASVLAGVTVDAILVRGDAALLGRVVAAAPAIPVLQVGPPLRAGARFTSLAFYAAREHARAQA